MSTKEEKKKPGRPRKKPVKVAAPRAGISATPKREDNCVELVYDEPMMFKRVLTLLKASASAELTMVFDMAEVRIMATDHLEKSDILITMDGAKMTHYYCKERVVACLKAENIEWINQVIDKHHTLLTILAKHATMRSLLTIIFQNEQKIDEVREVKLITPTGAHQFNPADFEMGRHIISFEQCSKLFKKFITNVSIFSKSLTIQKNGAAGPLVFVYLTDDKQVKSQHIVKDNDVIKLVSRVPDEEIFSVSVLVDYVKPFASSLVADTLQVHVDTSRRILFMSEVDGRSLVVKVAVDIISL